MSRVLFTWELGAGLGHLATIRSIVVPLIAAGHEVSVALRDLGRAHQFFGDLPVHFYQSPFFQGRFPNRFNPPATFPHVLYNCCCGDPQTLACLARAWQSVFHAAKPDLVLFDHSPSAIFASRGYTFRRATIGIGFFCPPDVSPLPAWRPQPAASPEQVLRDELRVLESLNLAALWLRQPELPRVGSLYAELDANYLCTYPELDHFLARQHGDYVGTWALPLGQPPNWPNGSGPRVFAYLKRFQSLPVLLYHLVQQNLPTIVYAPGAINGEFSGTGGIIFGPSGIVVGDRKKSAVPVFREMDFRRHDSGVQRPRSGIKGKPLAARDDQGPDVLLAHRRPRYPLPGCVVRRAWLRFSRPPEHSGFAAAL